MRIEVKGRNLPVSDELREHVEKRFHKVSRRCSKSATPRLLTRRWRRPRCI
jgi:putative sigma-54 modulation protein